MCDCYTIGGPWIAEDPNCPVHGREAVREREAAEDRMAALESEVSYLREEVRRLTELVRQSNNP